jgi:hypothetical protein
MKKTALNFAVDAIALVLCVLLGATGAVIRYVLPPGSGQTLSLWGFGRHDWGGIHFWLSVAFLAVMALHLVLHWAWILGMARGPASAPQRWRPVVVVALLVALAAVAAAPFLSRVQTRSGGSGEGHEGKSALGPARPAAAAEAEADNLRIRGSSTLADAAAVVGMPVADLLKTLKLPADTDPKERLGPLGKQHGFTPEDVRDLIRPGKAASTAERAP